MRKPRSRRNASTCHSVERVWNPGQIGPTACRPRTRAVLGVWPALPESKYLEALLANLDKTGERNGLVLADFSLTTDTKNDFAGVPPDKMKALLTAQAFAATEGGQIYIRTELDTGFYQMSQRNQDWGYYGASALSHEQVHRAGFREEMAYRRQYGVFQGFRNLFSDQALYGRMEDDIKRAWDANKNN